MIHSLKLCLLLVVLVLVSPVRQILAAETESVSDVSILIDVSGSMKKNDPNNLRSPALRMIVGLLPDGAKAGVWTFAKYVNMLVPHKAVDTDWRVKAMKQSDNIHSYGLFTNIEQVLNKSTAKVKENDPHIRRSIILLSDGLVDISKNIAINKKSRQHILDTIVPRLKKLHIAVHTIALSDGADHELLKAISLATDGWYEQVNDAEQLQRVFLHLFEKAAKRDMVPLLDNNFKIDDSVSQMTLLVFRQAGSKPTELIFPDQSSMTQQDKHTNVRWHSEDGYDLITIDKPLSGIWQIDANIDPDNRVMVVTDMKLQTTDLPNNILVGESFDFDASLTEKGEVIVRQDFLKLVDAQMQEESEIADPVIKNLNEQQKKGIYRAHIGDTFQLGRNDVVVTMKSATFERQRRQSINVIDTPFDINVEQLKDRATRTHRLTLTPNLELIKEEPLTIAALLSAEDGSEWSYEVLKNADGKWQLTLSDLNPQEKYTLALQIRGETVKGRSLFLQPKPITLEDEMPVKKPEKVIEQSKGTIDNSIDDEQLAIKEKTATKEQNKIEKSEPLEPELTDIDTDEMLISDDSLPVVTDEVALDQEQPQENSDGLSPALKLALGNVIILILIAMGIFFWRRKKATNKNVGDLL